MELIAVGVGMLVVFVAVMMVAMSAAVMYYTVGDLQEALAILVPHHDYGVIAMLVYAALVFLLPISVMMLAL